MDLFSDSGRQLSPGKLGEGLSTSYLQATEVQHKALETWVAHTALSPHP